MRDEGGGFGWCSAAACYCMLASGCLNRFVTLMNFITSLAISGVPSSVSIVIYLRSFLACWVRTHLSCAYAGQKCRKCSAVSSSSLHAGHLALSTLLIQLRYWFTGAVPILNCAIRLASMRLSSFWLIALRNFLEGVDLSRHAALFPHAEVFQSFFHIFIKPL